MHIRVVDRARDQRGHLGLNLPDLLVEMHVEAIVGNQNARRPSGPAVDLVETTLHDFSSRKRALDDPASKIGTALYALARMGVLISGWRTELPTGLAFDVLRFAIGTSDSNV